MRLEGEIRRSGGRFSGAVAACAGALAFVAAGTFVGAAEQTFRGETTVSLVEVPVRVADAEAGRAVSGLRAEDFLLLEDGREQVITNFVEIRPLVPSSQPAARPTDMVVVVDLLLADGAERDRVLRGLSGWWRDGLPGGVRVSLVGFDGSLRLTAERSRSPDELESGVAELGRIAPATLEGMVTMAPASSDGPVSGDDRLEESQRRQRSREFLDQLELRVARVGAAFQATMARFAGSESRLILVAFTPGVPRTNWSPVYSPESYGGSARQPVADLWNRVALEAADLGFTLLLCDVSGPRLDDGSEATSSSGAMEAMLRVRGGLVPRGENVPDASRMSRVDRPSDPFAVWFERSRRALLAATAASTGGEAMFHGDLGQALGRVEDIATSGYTLGFTPDHVGDGRVHTLEVRLRDRPDLRVVHRTAYVDRPASVRQAQRLRAEGLFGADRNPLAVEVAQGRSRQRGTVSRIRLQVPIEIRIPYARLDMVDRGDVFWGKVLISLFNGENAGEEARMWSHEQAITLPLERYQRAVEDGYFSFKVTVEVERGQEVYVGVQDLVGGGTSLIPQVFDR